MSRSIWLEMPSRPDTVFVGREVMSWKTFTDQLMELSLGALELRDAVKAEGLEGTVWMESKWVLRRPHLLEVDFAVTAPLVSRVGVRWWLG